MNRTMQTLAKMPITAIIVVVKFASNEMPWALRTCTIYGRIANIAVNCISMNRIETRANGLSVRFFVMSLNLSTRVGGGWVHFALDFTQLSHEADIWLISLSWLNSVETLSVDTHPRSTCNVFCASSERFFESSQIGASGTWKEEKKVLLVKLKVIEWTQEMRNRDKRHRKRRDLSIVLISPFLHAVDYSWWLLLFVMNLQKWPPKCWQWV